VKRNVMIAHELRNPLSMILLWGQIASRTQDEQERARALAAIRQCALEQAATIDRLFPR
jgi:signal transduction histidine kinase